MLNIYKEPYITISYLQLVCSVLVSAASAQYLAAPYALGAPLSYTYTPHVIKPVVKEVEVPIKQITYGIKETGCTNVFGFPVPCLAEGEARRKRSADEEAAEAAPAAPVLAYAGFPYTAAYGYPYTLPYTLPYAAAPVVKVAEPTVTEVEVPQIVYKTVEEKIDLAPLCHNGFGAPVPCA